MTRPSTLLLVVWLAFLARGVFYCVEQPLWEGFDEWAHFAYIQHVAELRALPSRTDPVSEELRQSLETAPLSPSAARIGPYTITFDDYWQLPPERRIRRASQTGILARQYEAQQPPLYYVLAAPVFLLADRLPLHAQVVSLRLAGMTVASSVIFLAFAASRLALPGESMSLLAAAFLACLPGFFIDVCRVGNDSLAIALTSAAILFALQARPLKLGVALGLDLLTKSYALALLPLIAIALWRKGLRWCLGAYAAALAIGGWWYARMWTATGTLSGEQLDAAASKFTLARKLAALLHVHWGTVLDIAVFSHIWMGGWSFLTLRRWMYRGCEAIAVIAAIGLGMYFYKHRSRARAAILLAAAFALMCCVLAYFALVAFLTQGANTANGWYLYPVIVPEAILLALGCIGLLGERRAPVALVFACCAAIAIDLYGVHALLMPYYSGLQHQPRELIVMLQRLGVSPALWIAYLCATAVLVGIAIAAAWNSRAGSDVPLRSKPFSRSLP